MLFLLGGHFWSGRSVRTFVALAPFMRLVFCETCAHRKYTNCLRLSLILLVAPCITATASSLTQPNTRANPVTDSTAQCITPIWRSLKGPTIAVQVGDRILKIPSQMPFASIRRENARNSVWFSFHIDKTGNLTFGGPESGNPYLWEYMLSFFVIDTPGRKDNLDTAKSLLQGYQKDDVASASNPIFDVYHTAASDFYFDKDPKRGLVLSCFDLFPHLSRKQVPSCIGYDRPWQDADLSFTFGRQLLPIAPKIFNCISQLLSDFSR